MKIFDFVETFNDSKDDLQFDPNIMKLNEWIDLRSKRIKAGDTNPELVFEIELGMRAMMTHCPLSEEDRKRINGDVARFLDTLVYPDAD